MTSDTGDEEDSDGSSCSCAGTCCGGTDCVDLQSDPDNCGSCGHGCLGGTCAMGYCQPFTIAPVPSAAATLTLDDSNVYFATDDGLLLSCPKTGCTTPTTLVSTLNGPQQIVYDPVSTDLFVADSNDDSCEGYTTLGTSVFVDDVAHSFPTAVALDSTYAYWGLDGDVVRTTRDGQNQTPVVTGLPGQVFSLTIDAASATLYIALDTGPLLNASTGGTGAWGYFAGTDASQAIATQLVVQDSTVYWITAGTSAANNADAGVYSCPTTGCSSPTAVPGTTPVTLGSCLFVDSTSIHYAADFNFYVCPIAGCPNGPMATAASKLVPARGGLTCAEDATSYYFLLDTGVVQRLAK